MIEIDAMRIPVLVAGLATAAAGAWSVSAGHRQRIWTILGLILICKGVVLTSAGLISASNPEIVRPLLLVQHGVSLAIVPLAVYLLATLVNGRMRMFNAPGAGWALVALLVVLGGTFAANPDLVLSMERGEDGQGIEVAGPGWVYTGYGPLVFLLAAAAPTYAVVGLALVWGSGKGGRQHNPAMTWTGLALLVNGIFEGGLATAYLIHDPTLGAVEGLGWIRGIAHAAALLPAGAGVGILIGSELSRIHPSRLHVAVPAIAALAAWFSGPMQVILGAPNYGATWPTAVAIGLWRTVVAAIVGVGLWHLRTSVPAGRRTSLGAPVRPAAEEA